MERMLASSGIFDVLFSRLYIMFSRQIKDATFEFICIIIQKIINQRRYKNIRCANKTGKIKEMHLNFKCRNASYGVALVINFNILF